LDKTVAAFSPETAGVSQPFSYSLPMAEEKPLASIEGLPAAVVSHVGNELRAGQRLVRPAMIPKPVGVSALDPLMHNDSIGANALAPMARQPC
jgi:hypothetical protein